MGSATAPNVVVEKVHIGSTSVSNPIFFIEYGGSTYGNSIRVDTNGNISATGITSRIITITSDSSGNIYATSVGTAYIPDLSAISMGITVKVVG
jgi:hypothetical protein